MGLSVSAREDKAATKQNHYPKKKNEKAKDYLLVEIEILEESDSSGRKQKLFDDCK